MDATGCYSVCFALCHGVVGCVMPVFRRNLLVAPVTFRKSPGRRYNREQSTSLAVRLGALARTKKPGREVSGVNLLQTQFHFMTLSASHTSARKDICY